LHLICLKNKENNIAYFLWYDVTEFNYIYFDYLCDTFYKLEPIETCVKNNKCGLGAERKRKYQKFRKILSIITRSLNDALSIQLYSLYTLLLGADPEKNR
jgi:hypothetical protein